MYWYVNAWCVCVDSCVISLVHAHTFPVPAPRPYHHSLPLPLLPISLPTNPPQIQHNIELRHEAELTHEHLTHICNCFWADKPAPLIPAPWPLEMQEAAESAAFTIQRRWIQHAAIRRQKQMLARQKSDRALRDEGILSPPGAADARALHAVGACPPTSQAARQELTQTWYPPDMELAQEYADWNHPRIGGPGGPSFPLCKTTTGRYCVLGGCGEQLDLWDEGQVSELSFFGSGTSNFFKFEKWCAWTSLCLFLIYSPLLVLNVFGSGERVRATGRFADLAMTTLGSLFQTLEQRQGTVVLPLCEQLTRYFPAAVECTMSIRAVAMLYTHVDIAACIFLYIAFVWLKIFQKKEAQYLDRYVVREGRQGARVRGVVCVDPLLLVSFVFLLPPFGLSSHSASNLPPSLPPPPLPLSLPPSRYTITASDFTARITNLPPKVTETDLKVHFARALNLPVTQVALGYDNAQEIEQHKLRGRIMKRRNVVMNRCRYLNEQLGGNESSSGKNGGVLSGAQRWLFEWELRSLTRQNEALLGRLATLDTKLELTHQETRPLCAFVTFHAQEAYVEALHAYKFSLVRYFCMPHELRLAGHRLQVAPAPEPSLILWENLQFGRFAQFKRKVLTTVIAGSLISVSIVLAFVARHYQDRNLQQQQASGSRDNLHTQALATIWTVFASCSTVGINYLIQLGLQRMIEFEKAHSLDRQQLETTIQLFALKFVNTAGVLLLLNSKEIQDLVHVKITDTGNFVKEWYFTTGLSLLLIMLINVVSPILLGLQFYFLKWRAQRKAALGQYTGFMTQDAANEIFMGPEFAVSFRYSSILVTFFVCFVYAATMPILLLIGALSFYAGYWVDKFLFLRFYRIPPSYGRELSRGVANTIQVALLLHVLVSIWSFSQDDLFVTPPDTTSLLGRTIEASTRWMHRSIARHLQKSHIQPLLVLFLVLAATMLVRQVFNAVTNTMRALFRILTCRTPNPRPQHYDEEQQGRGGGCCSCACLGKADGLESVNCIDVTYPRAVERGLIKGLHTYNILANPRYKNAFGIGDGFAEKHCHVESTRGHLALPFDDEESDGMREEGEEEEEGEGGREEYLMEYECDVEAAPRGLLLVSPPPSAPHPPSPSGYRVRV